MPLFHYHAKDQTGKVTEGTVEAGSVALAEAALQDRGLEVVLIEAAKTRFQIPGLGPRVKAREVVIFARQLAVLQSANIPVVAALRTAARQTASAALRTLILTVADEVQGGARLSQALGRHSRVFDNFFVSMIASGETAGRLSEVLNYLADQKERDHDLAKKVQGALIYPAFIVFGMVVISVILMVYVVPQLTAQLIESGAPLPLTTRMLIGASSFLKNYGWVLLVLFVAAIVLARFALRKSPEFRRAFDQFKLRLPIFGPLLQKIQLARFTRSFHTLLEGGIEVVGSLEVVYAVVGNAYYKELVRQTVQEVGGGGSLTTVFSASPLVPPMMSQMLGVGEETGRLTHVLEKLNSFYSREVENSLTTLVSIIEPLLMVVIGLGVGLVVSAIILPMYRLAGSL